MKALIRFAGCFFLAFYGYTLPQNVAEGNMTLIVVDMIGIAGWTVVFVALPYRGLAK